MLWEFVGNLYNTDCVSFTCVPQSSLLRRCMFAPLIAIYTYHVILQHAEYASGNCRLGIMKNVRVKNSIQKTGGTRLKHVSVM